MSDTFGERRGEGTVERECIGLDGRRSESTSGRDALESELVILGVSILFLDLCGYKGVAHT
jgi:hypothetical protein